MSIKETLEFIWYLFLIMVLVWLISHIFIAIIKTIFCDVQIKLYRTWCKRLKRYMNDDEIKKVLDEISLRSNK